MIRPMDPAAPPQLGTLLLCDLVDSTALVERMGDRQAAELLRRHDRIARDLMQVHHGREIDKTDGFLVLFERPVHAVAFALDYQRALKTLSREERTPLRTRVGIHTGEIMSWENNPDDIAHGAKRVEIEGLVKPVAARLMSLALPDQILLSSITYSLALRAQSELPGVGAALRWKAHGDYQFKGVPEPMAVVEVGEKGLAPFHHPPSSAKAQRVLPWWRRPATLAAEAGALLLLVGIVLYVQFVSAPAIAFAERDWVVASEVRNLTGQSILDDSLDAAFRVGLEQSRFVNVLPDLQVRDALQRMERDPSTRVDRAIAAEIAQREGARAVVAPSISEVGGRVRFTVEVIEPRSGRTAYSESADGRGLESALGSMDAVLKRMRARLGESLDRIESDSEPLEQVTSGNLEALKAFSLAIRAVNQGDGRQAMALYERAIELDPGFAAAHAKLGAYFLQAGDGDRALHHLRASEAQMDRLIPRDRLYVEGHLAFLLTPDRMLDRWSQLATLYPDFHTGQQNLGMILWMFENQFADAEHWFREVAESRHPLHGISLQGLSRMRLAQGDFEDAHAVDQRVLAIGATRTFYAEIDTLTAMRQYAKAAETLHTIAPRGFSLAETELQLRGVTLYADRGELARALSFAHRAEEVAVRHRLPGARQRARLAQLHLLAARDDATLRERLRSFIGEERARLPANGLLVDASAPTHLMLAGLHAARAGHLDIAVDALETSRPRAEGSGFHDRESLFVALSAQIDLGRGDAPRALERLAAWLDRREPFQLRVVAWQAARAAGRMAEAKIHAEWLIARRGQGLAEYTQQLSAQSMNVMSENEARLWLASRALDEGELETATAWIGPLRDAWQDADPDYRLVAELGRLIEALDGSVDVADAP
ncbi:MAG TPA: putative peptide modification system cyclase [Xanthomonadaceae bacterium]|nr:putative peptide modification system cyclase [Xanthomonadaceae bacterium]